MSSYNLDVFFRPRNVVVVGASARANSVGNILVNNLMAGNYKNKMFLVNPKGGEIAGLPVAKSVSEVDGKPDLAVIAVGPQFVPEVIEQLGQKGARGAVIITAGLGSGEGSITQEVLDIADKYKIRVIGPNCVGILAPPAGLNGSFCHLPGLKGDVALISQSGAIVTSVADWATRHHIGFSALVSLGDKADVDFGDMLDYFAMDFGTRAILLYVESIKDARKFMSSARAAARAKPIVLIKSGRHAEGATAAASHTGALAGVDAVYDAAFERAGLLRVDDLDEFFDAVETLTHVRKLKGPNLSILTNGGGIGVLAVDDLIDVGGQLAKLTDETTEKLNACLPATWSKANPVDIIGDAGPERYKESLEILMEDKSTDAILVMACPTALADTDASAKAIVEVYKERKKSGKRVLPLFAAWLGGGDEVGQIFEEAGIPHFPTPADAIRGYSYVVKHRQVQNELMRMPPALGDFEPDYASARAVFDKALGEGKKWLNAVEFTKVLEAYDLPIAASYAASSGQEAAKLAAPLIRQHGAAVVKIDSPDIQHKSDMGGVILDLASTEAVAVAADDVIARAKQIHPKADVRGVTIHPMIRKPHAIELIAGMTVDKLFGPVMVFGRGGTAVEVIRDKALALAPLDMLSAEAMMEKTRVNRLLKGYRDKAPCDREDLKRIMVKLSQLVADFPEIQELDFNPILADAAGNAITDARVRIEPVPEGMHPHKRFAIKPYPKEWEQERELKDGRKVLVRPMRPEDEALYPAFFEQVTDEDLRLRFFSAARTMTHAFIARLTQIDYARSMAFIALDKETGEMLGSVRLMGDANHEKGEYAVMVRSDLKGQGLGWKLMKLILEFAEKDGFKEVDGEVLRSNRTMRSMCEALGFETKTDPDDPDLVHMIFHVPEITAKIADLN